jgi:hypothetical protein
MWKKNPVSYGLPGGDPAMSKIWLPMFQTNLLHPFFLADKT